jgi:hypothetical protein
LEKNLCKNKIAGGIEITCSTKNPKKKTDSELWSLLIQKLSEGNYIFLEHAKMRLKDRGMIDIDILDILENKNNRKRKRNKSKDTYTPGYQDWNYCIEGNDLSGKKIRVIVSFDDQFLLIITVILIGNEDR